jgi:hypothetical protein
MNPEITKFDIIQRSNVNYNNLKKTTLNNIDLCNNNIKYCFNKLYYDC